VVNLQFVHSNYNYVTDLTSYTGSRIIWKNKFKLEQQIVGNLSSPGFTFTFIVTIIISVFVPGRSCPVQKLKKGVCTARAVQTQKLFVQKPFVQKPGTKTEIIIVTINVKVNPGDDKFAAICCSKMDFKEIWGIRTWQGCTDVSRPRRNFFPFYYSRLQNFRVRTHTLSVNPVFPTAGSPSGSPRTTRHNASPLASPPPYSVVQYHRFPIP
jgi:hypothetical protein